MALEFGEKEEIVTGDFKLEEDLYRTEDGEVVRAGTGRAESLYKAAGQTISTKEAEELGLIEKPEPKKAAKPADKKRSTAKNKQKS